MEDSSKARYKGPHTVIAEGVLLTLDDQEAFKWGFSGGNLRRSSRPGKGAGMARGGTIGSQMERIVAAMAFQLRVHPLRAGLAALYLEYKMPGTGIFGSVESCFWPWPWAPSSFWGWPPIRR